MLTNKGMKKTKSPSNKDPIGRICDACLAYARGEMTTKQVWYRLRGAENFKLIQLYPDRRLGEMLFILALDFQSWYGDRDDIIGGSIRHIARYLEAEKKSSPLH